MIFELSAEQRNVIYEELLIFSDCGDPIRFRAATGLQVPALLQVCRQTRNEAASIYFHCNAFELELENCKPSLLYEWLEMAKRYIGSSDVDRLVEGRWIEYSDGEEHYLNIIQWCKLVHGDKLPVCPKDYGEVSSGGMSPLVVAGIRLAFKMRDRTWRDFLDTFDILCAAVESARGRCLI